MLGYHQGPLQRLSKDIYDPSRLNPVMWFQQIDDRDATDQARRAQRNRIHFDLNVPDDQVEDRINAALAAGGRILDDAHAPAWWTITYPEGNDVDIAVGAHEGACETSTGEPEEWEPWTSSTG